METTFQFGVISLILCWMVYWPTRALKTGKVLKFYRKKEALFFKQLFRKG